MGTVYEKSGKLFIGFKRTNGKWCYRTTRLPPEREREAHAILERVEARIAANREYESVLGGPPTVRSYVARWNELRLQRGIGSAKDDATRLRNHALPKLGELRMVDVRPRHIRDLIRSLRVRIGVTKDAIAPRTVRHVYGVLHTMFRDAVVEELLPTNPCALGRDELPKKIDKDPAWRAGAVFTRTEIETVISDARIPWDRRVTWAFLALTGVRFGEMAAARWRAYDQNQEPLGMLSIHASYCAKTKKEKAVKTEVPRRVPVHPVLASVLAEWKLSGWEAMVGRPPRADDLIIPSRRGRNQSVGYSRTRLHLDLDNVGFRKRRQHDLRRTFITLAIADGARKDVLRWVTHQSEGDILDLYTTLPWKVLCEEVSKLNIKFRRESDVLQLPVALGQRQRSEGRCGPIDRAFGPSDRWSGREVGGAFTTSLTPEKKKTGNSRPLVAEVHGNRNRLTRRENINHSRGLQQSQHDA